MIPIRPKAITLLWGPVACGRTTALFRTAVAMGDPWLATFDTGMYGVKSRMDALQAKSYHLIISSALFRIVETREDIGTLFVDAADQIIGSPSKLDVRWLSAAETLTQFVRTCKKQNTGLVFTMQGPRNGGPPPKWLLDLVDDIWSFPRHMVVRCERGPSEGQELTIPKLKYTP